MGPWPSSSSTALASLGAAGCPQGCCVSLCACTSFHFLIYSVNKELSQQRSSSSGVCWSQCDLQPPWTHWFYSLGGCSDQTYTLCRKWCLQSAVNSNKAKADLRGRLNGKHERPQCSQNRSSFLFCSFSFFPFLPFLPPFFLPHSFPSFPSFLSSFLPSFLPSLSLLLSRYSYQSPAMENAEFLLAHWYCAGIDFSALWTGLSETAWSVQGGHWHFHQYSLVTSESKMPHFFFTDLNLTNQWNKKWTKNVRDKEGREGITW